MRRFRIGAACVLLVSLSGCTMPLFKHKIALDELHFDVGRQANGSTPFAVELVAVDDDTLLATLLTLTAAQWFDPQANWKRDYPTTLHNWYYEVTPGQHLCFQPTAFSGRHAQALLLFANYKGPGAYRLRLDSYSRVRVAFAEYEIEVVAQP